MRVAILTVSDRSAAGAREDLAGPGLSEVAVKQGWTVAASQIVPDEVRAIKQQLEAWAASGKVDLILTTGGTGLSPRDVTPEATKAVADRLAPGLAEAMRASSLQKTPHAMLSRATAGIRHAALIVNLPGSPRGAVENLTAILPALPHAIKTLQDDPQAEQGHVPRPKDQVT